VIFRHDGVPTGLPFLEAWMNSGGTPGTISVLVVPRTDRVFAGDPKMSTVNATSSHIGAIPGVPDVEYLGALAEP
jgi:hypothetical protein